MIDVKFYGQCPVSDDTIGFAVIAARLGNKWLLCRHKERNTWEIPGGHHEFGETIDQAARRELFEETGARKYTLHRLYAYSVTTDGEISYGMLYLADIEELGALPEDSEIGEVKLFDILPDNLTYPEIQTPLYHRVQGWLNLQSAPEEMWDVLDENRMPTGRLHRRGEVLAEGDFHLTVHVWVKRPDGKYLLTQRSANKGYPLMWEVSAGSAVAGDDSLHAALREVREETGLILQPENGRLVRTDKGSDVFADMWLFQQDFSLEDVILLEGETCDARAATKEDILQLAKAGKFVPVANLQELLEMMEEL